MKVCDKTCIFFFFPIIDKYFLMAKRSLLSRCPSYNLLIFKLLLPDTNSTVSTATKLQARQPRKWVLIPVRVTHFTLLHGVHTSPASRRIKLPSLTADHSLPPSTKVKNAWSYTSTPLNGTVSEQTHGCHL